MLEWIGLRKAVCLQGQKRFMTEKSSEYDPSAKVEMPKSDPTRPLNPFDFDFYGGLCQYLTKERGYRF